MIKIIDCSKSSHISAILHSDETETLRVEYSNGEAYNYFGVPVEVADKIEKAESKGKALHEFVYGLYTYRRV
jgi:hypothetical protein